MPAQQYQYQTFTVANQATANAAETVIATTRAVNSAFAGAQFGIRMGGLFTAGASTTSVTFRIRQSSLTGTAILTAAGVIIAAAQIVQVMFEAVDGTVAESSGALWVLTATQAAGTAPGGLTNGITSVTSPV